MSTIAPATQPRAAAISMIAAMAIIGCIDNVIVTLSAEIGLWQFYLMRAVVAVPVILVCGLLRFGDLRPRRVWAVALRGGILACAMVFYFGALAFVTLPQALAGLFTAPIFVLLLSAFVLRQRVGPYRILAIAAGFGGTLLVISPWQDALHVAALLPVVGGFLYALGAVATRTICAGEPVLAMLLALFVAQAVLGGLGGIVMSDPGGDFFTRAWVWPMSDVAWGLVVLQAIGSVIGVGFLFRAYSLGEASYVTVFEYSVFVFGAFFAWVLHGQVLNASAILGICLVCAAGAVIVLRDPDRQVRT